MYPDKTVLMREIRRLLKYASLHEIRVIYSFVANYIRIDDDKPKETPKRQE